SVWHANEGHTAFMMMERLREFMTEGKSFDEALSRVRAATVFTTHTPVQAGHDVFPMSAVEACCTNYCQSLGIDCGTLLNLGRQDDYGGTPMLNMTALAMRMSDQRCAVSALHEKVTKRMWHALWPNVPEDKVPITHVTNGVHVSSWIAPELFHLFVTYLGKDWINRQDDKRMWDKLMDIPDEEVWSVSQQLKRKLVGVIKDRMRSRWVEDNVPWGQMLAMGALFDADALTIAYARRFVEYKRPAMIFRDIERLKRIVTNPWRPIQIVFAGKSHPADFPSKHLLHQVYELASDRAFQGRIVFIDDYDIHIARYLTQGVDLWLNMPRRLQEASGTSGMKAALNGTLNFSVLDGWWYEGYNGENGWMLGDDIGAPIPEEEDKADVASFYQVLEEKIVPLYYARDRNGVSHGWAQMMKNSMRSIIPAFCAQRMVKEYTEKCYRPAAQSQVTKQPR
ncbi:MAG: alpha-glucan family phosphorylase, partial [Dehalococcoidales bacterium]|nr:alpha-glucan family phosphorylase [Dehalococcoidales bacterium]